MSDHPPDCDCCCPALPCAGLPPVTWTLTDPITGTVLASGTVAAEMVPVPVAVVFPRQPPADEPTVVEGQP